MQVFGSMWLFSVIDLQVMTDTIEKPQMPEQITRKSEEIDQEAGIPFNVQVAKMQRERDELK